jgi:hypothetical protein
MHIIALARMTSKARRGVRPLLLASTPTLPFRLSRVGVAGAAAACTILAAGFSHTGVGHAAEVAQVTAAPVPTTGLVARYLFNGNADDSSGHGHHGVKHNVLPTSDRFGQGSSAYSFNGTDAYIEIPDRDDFSVRTTGQLTIWPGCAPAP